MDYLRIGRLIEKDFDTIVENVGGMRFTGDHAKEEIPNADYRLGSSIVELKILEEEGLEKKERRQKLATLFRTTFPDMPTLILLPDLLEEKERQKYYRVMETPIKNHVKKAAKQLSASANNGETKILLLVNNGYGALSHEEFKTISEKCSRHDTSNIDILITCGLYYYSDKFDSYFLTHFETIPINDNKEFKDKDLLLESFNGFIQQFMTDLIRGTDTRHKERLPLVDFEFELDGYRFVKLAPKMGPSKFWLKGRPRKNSTGIDSCPPVAMTFPDVSLDDWTILFEKIPHGFWKKTYQEWLVFRENETSKSSSPLRPSVPIYVIYDDYNEWRESLGLDLCFSSLCNYAGKMFNERINRQLQCVYDKKDFNLILQKYVLLVVEEIGQDKANDISSIYLAEERFGEPVLKPLVENQRIFYEHALGLACAYAIKHGSEVVLHDVDKTFCWE